MEHPAKGDPPDTGGLATARPTNQSSVLNENGEALLCQPLGPVSIPDGLVTMSQTYNAAPTSYFL